MISQDQLSEILMAIDEPPKGLRPGQAAMNLLYKIDRKIYAEAIENGADSFYQNSKCRELLEFLETKVDYVRKP